MNNNQFRLLWSSVSTSGKIRAITGDRWFRIGCHLVYTWLIPWGDDDGRLRGAPLWVLANILPNEGLSIGEINKILHEIHRVNLITWYEIDGEQFIQIVDWNEHQSIRKDRYKPSTYPPCQPIDNQLTTNCQQNVILSPSPSPSPSHMGLRQKNRKPFTPPSLDEAKLFFKENGFTEESAETAWKYYQEGDWKDSKGNQVLNWKQKFRAVWFKDENKTQANNNRSSPTTKIPDVIPFPDDDKLQETLSIARELRGRRNIK